MEIIGEECSSRLIKFLFIVQTYRHFLPTAGWLQNYVAFLDIVYTLPPHDHI